MRLAGLRRAGAGSCGFYKESFGAKSVGMAEDQDLNLAVDVGVNVGLQPWARFQGYM